MPLYADENRVKATRAQDTNGSIVSLYVDSISGRLLAEIVNSNNSNANNTKIIRDENRIVVGFGVSSADGKTPIPIIIDPITGGLMCET